MKIEKLVLKGFNRITQNGFNGLSIEFDKPMQIILGSNGSGKSSLMQELSPLPPTSSDFTKDGYKEVHFTHNGSKYTCISDLSKGHTFVKDGVVLNDYGTAQVQKSIIEKELGLTPALFDVLCANNKFTEMSPTERRDWIISLSGLDVDNMIKLFVQTKDRHRDAKVYLDRVTQRLKTEEQNLPTEEHLNEMTAEVAKLKRLYELTLNARINTGNKEVTLEQINVNGRVKLIQDKMVKIMQSSNDVERPTIGTESDLSSLKTTEKNIIVQLDQAIEDEKAILEYENNLTVINNVSIEELEEKLSSLTKMLEDERIPELKKFIRGNSFTEALNSIKAVYDNLSRVCEELRNDEGIPYLREYHDSTKAEMDKLYAEIDNCNERKSRLIAALDHYHGTPDNKCPKCAHIFKALDQNYDIDEMKLELEKTHNEYNGLMMKKACLKTILDGISGYRNTFSSMMNLLRQTQLSDMFYQTVIMIKPGLLTGKEVMGVIHHLIQSLTSLTVVDSIEADIEKLKKDITHYHAVKETLVQGKKDGLPVIQEKIAKLKKEHSEIRYLIEKLERDDYLYSVIEEDIGKLNGFIKETDKLIAEAEITEFNADLDKLRIELSLAIDSLETRTKEVISKRAIYQDITEEKRKAEINYKSYQVLLQTISPNSGIIADVMNEAITNFVKALNNVINAVWTTEIEVLPCINKKNDLDWKFPVSVGKGVVRPDVSRTSTSQTDIINLAFQLIVAKTLGYSEFPLFADELGSSMDDQHRINMMKTLAEILESKQCSQLFMVSHFAAMHDQFSDADIIVLNDRNILNLPTVTNKHVEFLNG